MGVSVPTWRIGLVVLVCAIVAHLMNDCTTLDMCWPPSHVHLEVERHFTDTYHEARALFRERASHTRAELHAIPLPGFAHLDLTIDVAVFRGSSKSAMLHISGTHGVEGFAGSGIQCALLEKMAGVVDAPRAAEAPTLIFVHALNPYGMAKLRRFNEHNVDLNRNFLTPEQFKARREADPNAFGYVDLMDGLNPQEPTQRFAWVRVFLRLLGPALLRGLGHIKRASVGGNYHFPKSIFYGGVELEPSGVALHQLLRDHLALDELQVMGIVDVHTGLGIADHDTLMFKSDGDVDLGKKVFPGRNVVFNGASNDTAAAGYDTAGGLMCAGLAWFLPAHTHVVCVTQEFGTAHSTTVFNAMVRENAMYHYAPTRRLPYAEKLRDVFYLHQSPQWKVEIVTRGVDVFNELHHYVDNHTVT